MEAARFARINCSADSVAAARSRAFRRFINSMLSLMIKRTVKSDAITIVPSRDFDSLCCIVISLQLTTTISSQTFCVSDSSGSR